MRNPFIWLSGADTSIIDQCPHQKRYEKIKFSGIGALVLIPAVVGLLSMSYAVSTITDNAAIYIGAGVVWGLIVLAIDRLLVSTTNKSTVNVGNRRYPWMYTLVSVLARYTLAIFLGIAVSHPLILLWFNESIAEHITKRKDKEISSVRIAANNRKLNIADGPLTAQIKEKTALRTCKEQLLTNEQSGMDSDLWCGSTRERSGRSCGPNCDQIRIQIDRLTKEIAGLKQQAESEDETSELNQRNASLATIESDKNKDLQRIENRKSDDYLARVDALAEIENGNADEGVAPKPHVWRTSLFILLFFVFIDILAITAKLVIPMGEYEMIRDKQLDATYAKQQAERIANRVHASTVYQTTFQWNLDTNGQMEKIAYVTKMTMDFIRQQEDERIEFNRKLDEIRKSVASITDAERQTKYADYITRIKETFDASLDKSLTQFLELIRGL